MSYFCGCNNLVLFFFLLLFFCFVTSEGRRGNPLYELSTREEMVKLAGYGEERLSTALVTGTVLCQSSSDGKNHVHALPVAGASLAISCKTDKRKGKSNWAKGTTDEYGDFIIYLPSHLHAIPNLDRSCLIRVLRLPKSSPCRPALITKHRGIRFSSMGNGIRAYTAGNIRLNSKVRFSSHHSKQL